MVDTQEADGSIPSGRTSFHGVKRLAAAARLGKISDYKFKVSELTVLMIGEHKGEPRDCSKLVRGTIADKNSFKENYLEVRYEDGTVARIDGPFCAWPNYKIR